ncbi:MAG: MMPL family transporter [Myxococcales bacterium]|nr:MMPL family transporter [Myxococcales bacterium]
MSRSTAPRPADAATELAATRGTPRTRWLAALIERRAGLIALLTLAFAVLAGLGASQLRIDQRLRKLLPDHFPSVAGMDRAAERLGNQSDIYVSIASPSREANIAFGEALAAELVDHPDLRWSLFRRDFEFFERHALLYADIEDLLDLRRRVIERIHEETRKAAYGDMSLLGDDEGDAAKEGDDPLGLDEQEIRRRYGLDQRSEYFDADEGRYMVLKARPVGDSSDVEFSRRLQADLQARIDALDASRFHPEMEIALHGSFVQHSTRVKRLQGEVIGGTAAAIAALLLSIAVFFRSARAVLLVLGPLLVAGVGALAFAWLVYDVLNLVSAFIFAVLLGLGIDFGIHVLARYRDERARGHRRPTALAITLATTGRSTLAGGAGTGLAFSALTIADFQGFAQFGVVATFGLVLSLVAALVVMPALLVLSERVRPWAPPRATRGHGGRAGRGRRLIPVVGLLALAGVAAAAYGAVHARDLQFEVDFRALGPKAEEDAERAAEHQVTYRDAIGKALTVAPAIVLTDSREQSQAVYRQLMALRIMLPEEAAALTPIPASREPSLADVVSPQDMEKEAPPPEDGAPEGGTKTPAETEPTTKPEPAAGAIGDDWDADPEDWDAEADATESEAGAAEGEAEGEAESEGEDDGASEDWDADPDDWDDEPRDEPSRIPGVDDPRFVALGQAEAARTIPDPETLAQLRAYSRQRRADMSDRLGAVTSIDAFVPTAQAAKLEIIADIRARIDDKRDAMSKDTQAEIDTWYDRLTLTEPIAVDDLPTWVQQQFVDAQGRVGLFVIAWTRGSKADYENSRRIYDALGTLVTPQGEIQVAAEFFVLPEVFEAIEADGPRVLLLAGVAMLLTAVLAFRGVGGPAVVALVVGSTLLWLVALMLALGWKLNFFNVIVLPLLIGMAQDDAMHIYQRWRETGELGPVLRETGGAVFLTTLTTVCGFAGILFANHRGLQSMAWSAVSGMTLALVAAVVLLPAALWVVQRLGRGPKPAEPAPPRDEEPGPR